MSIVRACLRICTVAALQGATWAGDHVYDSNNQPIDQAPTGEPLPLYIAVYTDFGEVTVSGKDVFAGTCNRQLAIEFRVAGPVAAGDGTTAPRIPLVVTDEAMELGLDMVQRQVLRALMHDYANPWGALWKGLVLDIRRVDEHRGAEAERGTRWAARGLIFHLDTIAEPEPGYVPPILESVFAAMEASDNAGLVQRAGLFRDDIGGAMVDWRAAQAKLGLTETQVRGLGIAPIYASPDTQTPFDAIAFDQPPTFIGAEEIDAGLTGPAELEEQTEQHTIAKAIEAEDAEMQAP